VSLTKVQLPSQPLQKIFLCFINFVTKSTTSKDIPLLY